MGWRKILKFKSLFIAITALVIFFLLYLLVNLGVHSKATRDASYASHVAALVNQTSDKMLPANAAALATKLKQFKSGGNINIEGQVTALPALDKYLSPDESNIDKLISLIEAGQFSDASKAADVLVSKIFRQKTRKNKLGKYLQFIAAVIIALLYLLVFVPTLMRMSDEDETEVVVKRESAGIMNTVSEGLFLLNHEHEIGVEQSASLKEMFKLERDLEGDFFDFIGQFVPQNTVQVAQDYIGLLFGERVKEKLVQDLNPLNEVEINIVRRDGTYESRFLDFKFNRVVEDDRLSHVLVSVTDQTRRVMLERELVESKQEQEAQLDLLMSILHVDNAQLGAFFDNADSSLNDINTTLEARGHGSHEIRSKITEIERVVHRLKGDSAALGLHKFEFSAHAFEEELLKVRTENETISGKNLLPAITKLKAMFSELDKMRGLVDKFSSQIGSRVSSGDDTGDAQNAVHSIDAKSMRVTSGTAGVLHDLVATVTERTGKRAVLTTFGMDEGELPEALAEPMQSIAVQLVRNSIVHGALAPEERIAVGKPDFINIVTSFNELEDSYQLLVRDDGEAFNDDKILERAIDSEIITSKKAEKIDRAQVLKLIFAPGFSSLDDASLDGGRGIGLDAVHSMVRELDGAITVQHKEGRFCQFKMTFPKQA